MTSIPTERVPLKHLPPECAVLTDVLRDGAAALSITDLAVVIQRDYPEIQLARPAIETVRVRLSLLFLSGWVSREQHPESGEDVYSLIPEPKTAEVAP